jgi:hypothetical protein
MRRGNSLTANFGYVLIALMFVSLFVRTLVAVRAGRPFIGMNLYGLGIPTYFTLATLVLIVLIGLAVGISRLISAFKRWRSK